MDDKYKSKRVTAKQAAARVQSGDRVYLGTASSFAYELMEALYDRRDELQDVTILCSMSLKKSRMFWEKPGEKNPFRISTYFLGAGERIAVKNGMPMEYTSFHLSQIDIWAREIARPDICFFETSRPDENGYFSYGPTGTCLHDFLREQAREIYLEANSQTPFLTGDRAVIHISEVDGFLETDNEVSVLPNEEIDELSKKISQTILTQVPDGATIQLGIGKLSTAVGYGLMEKNDLGIHSELFSEPMMHLMKNGNVTNRKKGFMDGVSVVGFSMGTKELFDYMNHNQRIYAGSFPFVNDARNIARNKNMISVNTAMSMDVFGQVAADSLGYHQQSAVGGQIDYVKGAQWSEGGKSFFAMTSSFMKNNERKSRITLNFPEGTAITTPRSEVQYVVTEYGMVNLKHLTMPDRIRAMIGLAHPEFRDQLTQEAKDRHLI